MAGEPRDQRREEWEEEATSPESRGGEQVTFKEAVEGAVETEPDLEMERKIKDKLSKGD